MYKAQFVQFVRCMKAPEYRESIEKSLDAEKVWDMIILTVALTLL